MSFIQDAQIWIVDFGSQYTQLITRKCRELGHSSVLLTVEKVKDKFAKGENPRALILSGGPASIFEDPMDYSFLFANSALPVLGICYGMQIMAHTLGGKVERGIRGEYGSAKVRFDKTLLPEFPQEFSVWMSHFDHVAKVPQDFEVLLTGFDHAHPQGMIAGIQHKQCPQVGIQFHPEVEHTQQGKAFLRYFLEDLAGLKPDWTEDKMLEEASDLVRKVGEHFVLCAFSGGVDSLVAAVLAQRILGDKLFCFFVDHGLSRPQDEIHIQTLIKESGLKIEVLRAREIFLSRLKGISDPEEKRKIIGRTFIDVFEQKVREWEEDHQIHFQYLLQGTLYPDVIESISPHGKEGRSVTIKSHHNVGGLPEKMKLKLVEPLRYFFKDEVRKLGEYLGLTGSKKMWVHRHPFPGPGLGVRILGEITEESLAQVGKADQILFEELQRNNLYDSIWQAFTVLLPVKTVGVKGDGRSYEKVICLRMVGSTDGMTAEWSEVPFSFLQRVSSRITNEVAGITRVVYDITSKPPGTIEWE